ncbi:hypothetical protein D1872_36260 [compost metagenome]
MLPLANPIVKIFGALQKVKMKDGKYAIVFPHSRAKDVYVDLDKKITLDKVLGDLSQNDTVGSRENMIQDLTTVFSSISNLLPKPMNLNNFRILDGTSSDQLTRVDKANGLDFDLIMTHAVDFGGIIPKKILIKDIIVKNNANPIGVKVFVTNNAFDSVVTWEDATAAYQSGSFYNFQNEIKQSDKTWGILVRYQFIRENATDEVAIDTTTISYL